MTIFHQRLVKNLKYYRKQKGLSQQKLAQACALSTNYIGEIEMARKFPSPDTMEKMIKVLDIQPETLFLEIVDHREAQPVIDKKGFIYASQLSEALIGYINESLGYYAGKKVGDLLSDHSPKEEPPLSV
ncbi:MAG: helix-turn-helix domain-containing protein [Spirochaetia bacterium]